MKVKCIWCGFNMEPNAGFCGECGTRPEKNELVCNGCRIKLSSNGKIYHLRESSGCLVFYLEYCKECYEAKLIEQAKWEKIYKAEEKAAMAACHNCRKPFPGIFRKKRYVVAAPWGPTRDYYCKDCFLALPKNEKLDNPNDFDPWL